MSGVFIGKTYNRFDMRKYDKMEHINKVAEITQNIGKRCQEAMQKDLEEKRKKENYKKLLFCKTRPKLTVSLKKQSKN